MSKKTKVIFLSVIFLLLALGLAFRPNFIIHSGNRMMDSETIETRFMAWEAGIKTFWDRPFIGYGLGNTQIGYNKYFNPKFQAYPGAVVWFDHFHNWYIDILAESGIIGFSAVMLLFFAIYKKVRKMPIKFQLVIFPGILAYLIHLAFIFPTFCDIILFLIILAFISNYREEDYE